MEKYHKRGFHTASNNLESSISKSETLSFSSGGIDSLSFENLHRLINTKPGLSKAQQPQESGKRFANIITAITTKAAQPWQPRASCSSHQLCSHSWLSIPGSSSPQQHQPQVSAPTLSAQHQHAQRDAAWLHKHG